MPKSSTPSTPYDKAASILAVNALVAQHGLRGLARALHTTTDEVIRWRSRGATLLGALRAEIRNVAPKCVLRPDVTPLGWQRETYRALAHGLLTVDEAGDLAIGTTATKTAARLRMHERGQRIRRADS